MAIDSNGSAFLTGYFNGELDFDPNSGVFNLAAGNGVSAFLLKLESQGTFAWARGLAANNGSFGKTVVTDADDNVFLTGQFMDTADFSLTMDNTMTSFGDRDVFVAKFNGATGDFLWHKQMGSVGIEETVVVAPGTDDDVYAGGVFQETVFFAPDDAEVGLTCAGTSDFFIARYAFPETSGTDAFGKAEVSVYPNPSAGAVFVNIPAGLLGAKAAVYTLLGQRVAQFDLLTETTAQTFAPGFYILQIDNGTEKQAVKFVVK